MNLEFEARALRDLEDVPLEARAVLWQRLQGLKQNPHGSGTKPLPARLAGLRRLRVGDWRVAYYVERDTVRVLAIGLRSRFYDELERRDFS